jgi:hypothetical protein
MSQSPLGRRMFRSTTRNKLAVDGVNARPGHFAIPREQSQHIDEAVAFPAEPGAHHFRTVAVRLQVFEGLGQRDGPMGGHRRALFRLAEAAPAVRRRIGSRSRSSEEAEHQGDGDKTGHRHNGVFKWPAVNIA